MCKGPGVGRSMHAFLQSQRKTNVDRAENGVSDVRGMYLFPGFFLPLPLLLCERKNDYSD